MSDDWKSRKTYEPSTLLNNWYEDRLKFKQYTLQPIERTCYDFNKKPDENIPDLVKHQRFWGNIRNAYNQQHPIKSQKELVEYPELFGADYNWGLLYRKRLILNREQGSKEPTTYRESYCKVKQVQ